MLYHIQGTAIITKNEFIDKSHDELPAFYAGVKEGRRKKNSIHHTVAFSTGVLNEYNAHLAWAPDNGQEPVPFQPIGLGKPLTIQIRDIYTGKYPNTNFFGFQKALLLTSAIKSIATFNAKPRALNFLIENVREHTHLTRSAASRDGTPIVYYSPALVDASLTMDLSIIFDTFPEHIFQMVGQTLEGLAGIPVFMAHNIYLMTASAFTKVLGSAGETIFDGQPAFDISEAVDICWPGSPTAQPGFKLITDYDLDYLDPMFRHDYQVNASGRLVDQTGVPYCGDIPYIVISLDGTQHDDLISFAPTAASAAVLSRFLNIKEGQIQSLDTLIEAVKLYNDFKYRQEVDRLDDQIKKLTDDNEQKKQLMEKREALIKNIMSEMIKPPQ